MDHKTKIFIALAIAVAVIIVCAVIMVMFVQNTEESNSSTNSAISNSNETVNTTEDVDNVTNEADGTGEDNKIVDLDETASFAIQERDNGNYLVKISEDLDVDVVLNVTTEKDECSFENYDYDNGILYLLYMNDEKLLIYSLDLELDSEVLIAELENNGYGNSFKYVDGKIYYVSFDSIYMYDIENDTETQIVTVADENIITNAEFDKENKIMYYLKDEDGAGAICKMDLDNLEEETIATIATIGNQIVLSDNNYLGISVTSEETEENSNGTTTTTTYNSGYIFNIETNDIWEICNYELTEDNSDFASKIAFSENYIAFSDMQTVKLMDYNGNELNSSLYSVSDENSYIVDVEMISDDCMQIRTFDNSEYTFGETTIINFAESSSKTISKNFYNIILK